MRVLARVRPRELRQRRGRSGRRRRHRRAHVHIAAGRPAESQDDAGAGGVNNVPMPTEAEIEQNRIQREMIRFDPTQRGPLDGVRVLDA